MDNTQMNHLITEALQGNSPALESILLEVQDMIFNLSLRMLGTVADAEDATQDILIRVMTNLSTFRGESGFHTWVYRIAANYLIDYKKSMFAQHPLDFDFYAQDIRAGYTDNTEELLTGMEREELAQELKMSCTNVMLQCFDPQTRCIFILGTMFKADSRIAGEILDITPENYRQKLSRARKKMAGFLESFCGLSGTGMCCCEKRVGYAVQQHRLNPQKLEFKALKTLDREIISSCQNSMEEIDGLSMVFDELPKYRSVVEAKSFLEKLLQSRQLKNIQSYV